MLNHTTFSTEVKEKIVLSSTIFCHQKQVFYSPKGPLNIVIYMLLVFTSSNALIIFLKLNAHWNIINKLTVKAYYILICWNLFAAVLFVCVCLYFL